MNAPSERRAFGDTRPMRIAALCVFFFCAGALLYLHRADLWPGAEEEGTNLNPDFVACRDERIATVDNMRTEGLIDDAKHTLFSERAVAVCASEFPMLQGGG